VAEVQVERAGVQNEKRAGSGDAQQNSFHENLDRELHLPALVRCLGLKTARRSGRFLESLHPLSNLHSMRIEKVRWKLWQRVLQCR
jgi:hypothetical protein